MPNDPDGSLSLLEAARVLAHGGDLDAKLVSLAEYARSISGAMSSAVFLFDPEAGHLVSPDGLHTIDPGAADDSLARAIRDRRASAVEMDPGRPEIGGSVPAPAHAYVPLLVEEDTGPAVEGVLVLGFEGLDDMTASIDAVSAVADLAAVAIRQVRLQNALSEQSAYHERLAHTDAMTGLANRSTFEQMLELELARAERQGSAVSVVLFAIDGLERITADQGAGTADDVLRQVAATLAAEVRLVDTVARLSGGEFGVVAPGDGGMPVAERVRQSVAALGPSAGAQVSVSVGLARSPDNGTTGAELLDAAVHALEAARASGTGSIMAAPPSSRPTEEAAPS